MQGEKGAAVGDRYIYSKEGNAQWGIYNSLENQAGGKEWKKVIKLFLKCCIFGKFSDKKGFHA